MRASLLRFFQPGKFLSLAVILSCSLHFAQAADSRKQMLKEAKVDRTHAEVIATGRMHGGKVQSSKIERMNGHLVWVVEVTTSNSTKPARVLVAADTGKILSAKSAK